MRCFPYRLDSKEMRWVEWCSGKDAVGFALEIERIKLKDEVCLNRIFHDSTYVRIIQGAGLSDFGRTIRDRIESYIRDDLQPYSQRILSSCVGFR